MNRSSDNQTSIIGAMGVSRTVAVDPDKDTVHKTNRLYWDIKGNDALGAIALPLFGAFVSEEKHQLFGSIAGKKVLEIGCGAGHSLQYMGERQAAKLWGLDLSKEQLEKARRHLASCGLSAELVCSPMEEECGIPAAYFDFVYSVYAIGWATDLQRTFCRIATYLKKDGVSIFSWSHPIHKCVAAENDSLVFKKSYFDESWYSLSLDGGTLSLADRKLSTYINALANAGFVIEQMVEQSDEELLRANDDDFSRKARMLPVTFVIKARKSL